MICTNCGANLGDDLKFCTQCGTKLEKQAEVTPEMVNDEAYAPEVVTDEVYTPEVVTDEAYAYESEIDEVYVPEVAPEYAYNTDYAPEFDQTQQAYAPQIPVTDPGKGLGIASMVVSIISVCICGSAWLIPSIVSLVLGIVANSKSKKAGFKNGFAIAGIAISAASLAFTIIASVIVILFYVFIIGGSLVLSGM